MLIGQKLQWDNIAIDNGRIYVYFMGCGCDWLELTKRKKQLQKPIFFINSVDWVCTYSKL